MTEPNVIHDEILLPHGTDIYEVRRRALAQAQAKSNLKEGESVEDLQMGTGTGTGPTSPMVKWKFSYQILRPGGSVAGRWR